MREDKFMEKMKDYLCLRPSMTSIRTLPEYLEGVSDKDGKKGFV
jgi:hypothetical protein